MDENMIRGIILADQLRSRFKKLGININGIGQFRGRVFIYLKNKADKEIIKQLLMDDELEIVSIE